MDTAAPPGLDALLDEYDRALARTDALWLDLEPDEVAWRPHPDSSAIGWHLGHQAAVGHHLLRNLIAAEPSPDPELDALMDSATPERERGELPDPGRLRAYRDGVADRVRARVRTIGRGEVEAPAQLEVVARTLVVALVNHEHQHARWIGEVRRDQLGRDLPPPPVSPLLVELDGYPVLAV